MDEREIWRPVPDYEAVYEVSNFGRVRSLTRTRMVNNSHGGVSPRTDRGRLLALGDNGNGYVFVQFRSNGKRRNYYVHRLVAEVFIGKPENGEFVVDHLDHNRRNNYAGNLEWVTQKENIQRSKELMRHPKKRCMVSSTGEKYISRYKDGYRVNIGWANVCKQFKKLGDAVSYRNEVMQGAR